MNRTIKVLFTFAVFLFILFLALLFSGSAGCNAELRQYMELKYPRCEYTVLGKNSLSTKIRVECPGVNPEVIIVRGQ